MCRFILSFCTVLFWNVQSLPCRYIVNFYYLHQEVHVHLNFIIFKSIRPRGCNEKRSNIISKSRYSSFQFQKGCIKHSDWITLPRARNVRKIICNNPDVTDYVVIRLTYPRSDRLLTGIGYGRSVLERVST